MEARPVLILAICLSGHFSFSQTVVFYDDVAPIIERQCTPCHKPGGEAPFSLVSYEDVARRASFIGHVTRTGYMPPWFAEEGFGEFRNERRLTTEEINTIEDWIRAGAPRGKRRKNSRASRHREHGAAEMTPDVELRLAKPFKIPGDNSEQYIFFSLPTELPEDRYISSIEFIPGNKKLVHHSRIMSDTSNLIRGIDGMSETDPRIKEFMRIPLYDQFLYGWVPGNSKFFFPPGTGKKLPANTDFVVNIHYAPSPVEEEDLSRVNVYLAREKVTREVRTLAITEHYITNQPFLIPAGVEKTFYARTPPLPNDISVIAVLPHMHLLGKSFMAYALTPDGDIIKLVRINRWNFNWQMTYQYKKLVKIPRNSVIYLEGAYDNTGDNPANPNRPPVDVKYGWNTVDEMMNFIIYYLDYQPGDEEWEY